MLTLSTPIGSEIVMTRSPVPNIPRKGERAWLLRWVDTKTRDRLCVVGNEKFPEGRMIMAAWARRADLPTSLTGILAGANAPGLTTVHVGEGRLALTLSLGMRKARATGR